MENKSLLKKIRNEMNENSTNELPCENNKSFDLANFIYSFNCNDDFECPEVFSKYDRLCKKIDVVGIVYTYYSLDLSKKMSERQLTQTQLERLSLNLMFLAIHRYDLKFANTLLKLMDSTVLNISESLMLLILECKERVFTYYE
ncbi:hypothetical protein [Psychromonas sp. Urea-02u-13]|uniref:hypothetical protein n=1 Tax=Psychromonas sp. Urea-02u-13 TaxID=2058326 RepID=UPI000C326B96|nr:hypothetical protein [Psychromonas sp. Urea-02u-13]PKG37967.1 hypothetical protein CXF74_16035 [Psychromonas sp. Urea-02u-13]